VERGSQRGSHGAVAGPLAGVRAPQRVSTPPSSDLAAAPPWPSPASSDPGSALFSPHADEAIALRSGEVGHPFPFFPFFSFGINPIWGWGQKLGLGFRDLDCSSSPEGLYGF